MHICISKLDIIGSDNGLSPGWCQAIIWKYAGIMLIWPSKTNFNEMLFRIHAFSSKKMLYTKKWQPFCLSLNDLTQGVLTVLVLSPSSTILQWLRRKIKSSHSLATQLFVQRHTGTIKALYYWIFCVCGIHWWMVDTSHKGPVVRKVFHDVILRCVSVCDSCNIYESAFMSSYRLIICHYDPKS